MGVYLFVPNLIGYVRIILAFAAFYSQGIGAWKIFVGCYVVSYVLDAVDGLAARALNQGSRFGAVLDMVTDRFCTNIMTLILAFTYRDYFLIFTFLAVLDLVSHWYHTYASLLVGESSHKNASADHHWMVNLYYTSRAALFWVCAAQELFYLLLYLNVHIADIDVRWQHYCQIGAYAIFPIFAFKQFVNCIQLREAADKIVAWDEKAIRERNQ
eukprot:GEMP01030903.1.p1 GENE.GEMP01030903.1~~GEMP01030903.1.p1  ORF type:complete len:230 (+),score=3.66 GEMP01030903.1:52-690(+)